MIQIRVNNIRKRKLPWHLLFLLFLIFLPCNAYAATQSAGTTSNLSINSGPTVSDVSANSANISWSTNIASTSEVVYDFIPSAAPDEYQSFSGNPTLNTSHSIILSDLVPSTTYHYRVVSKTADNINTAFSEDASFTTLASVGGGGGGFGGGGLGGSGGGPTGPGITNISLYVNAEGIFLIPGRAFAEDRMAFLDFKKGVKALQRDGNPLKSVSIVPSENAPPSPEGTDNCSLAYDFGPTGSTFSPSVTLALIYDPDALPDNFDPRNIIIATWNSNSQRWEKLDNFFVDSSSHTVFTEVTHFSKFCLFGDMKPASISMGNITVSPQNANIGETVSISTIVTNSGNLPGEYIAQLIINGETDSTQKVLLAGNSSKTVTFSIVRELPGEYEVEINGKSSKLTILALSPSLKANLKSLSVFPYETAFGEKVIISVVAENTGDSALVDSIVIRIDGSVVSQQEVSLAPYSTETIEFSTSGIPPGINEVDVNGQKAYFKVGPVLEPKDSSYVNWFSIGATIMIITSIASTLAFRVLIFSNNFPLLPPKSRRRS
jgi:hypothetical protein